MRKVELARRFPESSKRTKNFAFHAYLYDSIVQSVADVNGVFFFGVSEPPRLTHFGPLGQEADLPVEDLDTRVGAIGDINFALVIERDVVNEVKLAVARAFRTPLSEEFAVLAVMHDAGIDIAIGHEEISLRSERE